MAATSLSPETILIRDMIIQLNRALNNIAPNEVPVALRNIIQGIISVDVDREPRCIAFVFSINHPMFNASISVDYMNMKTPVVTYTAFRFDKDVLERELLTRGYYTTPISLKDKEKIKNDTSLKDKEKIKNDTTDFLEKLCRKVVTNALGDMTYFKDTLCNVKTAKLFLSDMTIKDILYEIRGSLAGKKFGF